MSKSEVICDCEVLHSEIVDHVRKHMPQEREFENLELFFKVFGDRTRVKIIWALDEHEMCVCDLAVLLNMTKSAISHQLSYLRQNRLVNSRRDGKVIFYSLSDGHIKSIFEAGREHINE
ncbi:MAG: metalloregulator ArsR/SmtB family transcription factor [Christensenellaceae bacterium]|jgi:ArsR family transcriptional regulator|nr:metalloregulator ArsR/SmtB family transcription factor [Christensenellaceae bacterium]